MRFKVTLDYSFGERVREFADVVEAKRYAKREGVWGYATGTVVDTETGEQVATVCSQTFEEL